MEGIGEHAIILYDGECSFCNRSVQFILRHDKRGCFRFAAQQGEKGRVLLGKHGLQELEGIVLVEADRAYSHSTAVLRICRGLPWPWKLAAAALLVPRPLRDGIYNIIARNRYRWFGRAESCLLPSPEQRARFLD